MIIVHQLLPRSLKITITGDGPTCSFKNVPNGIGFLSRSPPREQKSACTESSSFMSVAQGRPTRTDYKLRAAAFKTYVSAPYSNYTGVCTYVRVADEERLE